MLRFQVTPQVMAYTFASKDPKIDFTTEEKFTITATSAFTLYSTHEALCRTSAD